MPLKPETFAQELLFDLVRRPSVTPHDAGCSTRIAELLTEVGFACEWLNEGEVTNLWATWGEIGPLLVFAGHTDVVPPGPLDHWDDDPFDPTIRDGVLFGRGAADMKSGLAAMVTAVRTLLADDPPALRLALLITSDEEGPAQLGTRHVAKILQERGVKPDYVIVGEATADRRIGDRYIIGRRGSLGCNLKVLGVQGHVAYPDKADNPIHRLLPAFAELTATHWDDGNDSFPPTSLQISNLHGGTGASNVIPGHAEMVFNFRYSPASSAAQLRETVEATLERHGVRFEAHWWHSGEPYYTAPGALRSAAQAAIGAVTGEQPLEFTGGGTSDGRFLAPLGSEVIELGPINASIHKFNEHVILKDVDTLAALYTDIARRLA